MRVEPEQMLKEQRIAALGGVEDADADGALQRHQHDGDGHHRRGQHHQHAGRIVRPHKQGQTEPGHARRPHLVDSHDEVQSGEDGTETGNEGRQARRQHVGVHIVRGQGRGEGPARVHAAGRHGIDGQDAARHVEIPAQQVDLGQRQVLGTDHQRDQKIPQRGRNRWHQEEEDHDDAVHGEHLVIGVSGHQVGLRRQQFQADQSRQGSADEEEEAQRNQVENCNPLVIAGQQPAQYAVLLGDEIELRNSGRGLVGETEDCIGAHCFTIPFGAAGCPAGAVLPSLPGSRSLVFMVCWMR